MSHSLRSRLRVLCHKNIISNEDYDKLRNALDSERALSEIRAEIEGKYRIVFKDTPEDNWAVKWNDCLDEVLEVIDKYKLESEVSGMTREEAIRELRIKFVGEYDRQREAKDMAIKVLEREDILDKIKSEIEFEVDHRNNMLCAEDVFEIIDKYRKSKE